ncbi:MAG TPA: hypothetical protein VFW71_00625 [Actinomycetota bacterium]|nr:hypothetical protein [Actinomycetota bacterium]
MIPWMTGKLAEIRQLIQAGLVVAGILFIGHVWWKTKALVPTIGAVLLSGLVLWSTANIEWFQNEIGQEMHSLPAISGRTGGNAGA